MRAKVAEFAGARSVGAQVYKASMFSPVRCPRTAACGTR